MRQEGRMNPMALHEQAQTLLSADPRQRLVVFVVDAH